MFCDFGDFNTQELLPNDETPTPTNHKIAVSFLNSSPSPQEHTELKMDNDKKSSLSKENVSRHHHRHHEVVHTPLSTPSSIFYRNTPHDLLSYSTNSEAQSHHSNPNIMHINSRNSNDIIISTPDSPTKIANVYQEFNTTNAANQELSTVSCANSLSYTTQLVNSTTPLLLDYQHEKRNQYQTYVNRPLMAPPPLMPRPVPFIPVQAAPPPVPQRPNQQMPNNSTIQQQPANIVPFLPPKQHQPPPYRPPPLNKNVISNLSQPGPMEPSASTIISNNQMLTPTNRLLMMPPIEEDVSYMTQEPLIAKDNTLKLKEDNSLSPSILNDSSNQMQASTFNANNDAVQHASARGVFSSTNALSTHSFTAVAGTSLGVVCGGSSDGGGSHDSHNDSGYCVGGSSTGGRLGSGGPSPSLSGKNIIYKRKTHKIISQCTKMESRYIFSTRLSSIYNKPTRSHDNIFLDKCL